MSEGNMQKVSQLDNKLQADPMLCLEKEMATHSNILAWRTPQTEEPGRLQSMGSQELDTIQQLEREREKEILCIFIFSTVEKRNYDFNRIFIG